MTLIKGIASLAAVMLIGLSAPSAQAGYVVDLTQQRGNVVATGSGAIDLTGLSFVAAGTPLIALTPSEGFLIIGAPGLSLRAAAYKPIFGITGPTNFGSGGFTFADSANGDFVGISPNPAFPNPAELFVPFGYVSDSLLSSTATWDNQTLSSLGATPGTYKWTWGTGANQNITLVIGTAVPEPSTWAMMLVGFAALGFAGFRRARKGAVVQFR